MIDAGKAAGSMYLVLPVPMRHVDGRTFVEAQAANGMDRWADNFASVVIAAPWLPEALVPGLAGFVWRDVESLEHRGRITLQTLPWAYTPGVFFRHLGKVRQQIAKHIQDSDHLQFAIGGLIGDWAAVAALEAIRMKRRYAIHTDRVEHEVLKKTAAVGSAVRRVRAAVEAPLMKQYHKHVIRRCTLGLWHGDDCFRAYSPWCGENHLIHDVHTKTTDGIGDAELERKLEDVHMAEVLHVCYAGRLDPMKAPLEWLQAIATARDAGIRVKAKWYGEGPLLDEAKAERTRLRLEEVVDYPGFVSGRAALLSYIRAAHAMVFTHVTPESPRNLLEALVSGTPILGYDNAYAVNLLEEGGGAVVPLHDARALGHLLVELDENRQRLAGMVRAAARNGRRFSDTAVFRERSELIKSFA